MTATAAEVPTDDAPDGGGEPGFVARITGGSPLTPLAVLFGLNVADELDRSAFAVLLPDIRDHFGLNDSGILGLVAVATAAALLLTVPIASWADRGDRVRIALLGAAAWGAFSLGTGLAPVIWVLVAVRCGSAIGNAVIFPTHNSLLSDYYRPEVRPRIFSIHRAANAVGIALGTVLGAGLAQIGGWRTPFFVFAVPTFLLVVYGLRMKDPGRGHFEREAMGASPDLVAIDEAPPSYAEAYRMVWKIESLRRIFVALPFLAASIAGFVSIASLYYEQVWDLDELARAWVTVPVQMVELLGLAVGARWGVRLLARGPHLVFRFLAVAALFSAVAGLLLAWAPWIGLAVVANAMVVAGLAIVGPGVLASLSLAIPPRARSVGFSIGALFVLPGLVILPIIGWVGTEWGFRWGIVVLVPVFVIGGFILASAGSVIERDIQQVWAGASARAELLRERQAGRQKLLLVRGLDVRYGDVRILFGVDMEVEEGEVVALLGTNGAGKSTLLNAISGVTQASRGAVIFDGRDITHAPPDEIAALGISQVPGGKGVFPGLTVAENLRTAGWLARRGDRAGLAERQARIDEMFPILVERRDDPAADLSGGQQQMLALSMAFLTKPQLLVIDELSLGLAPVVVDQLLDVVRALRDEGTTILLVEQSVNVALSVADRAYFLEKGEVRYDGPTADLLDRPDVLRSVFLEGASKGLGLAADAAGGAQDGDADLDVGTVLDAAATSSFAVVRGGPEGNGHGRRGVSRVAPADRAVGLTATGLSVRFGGVIAVDDVSLTVAPGEVVGLIGPNGAGKTTLLDLLSGHTPADEGTVALGDRVVSGRSPAFRARAGLGRSFQDSRLFPSLTVEEAIAVALERWVDVRDPLNAIARTPAFVASEAAVAAEVDGLVDLLGLGAFRSKFVGELSTGSRRIVDLACVLAHRPDVVLLDEPSSGIAQREAEALGPLLLRIREALGASMVVIEHDMPLITSVSDRLVALDQGRVVTEGPPDDVLAHPDVVASYLGSGTAAARSGAAPPPGGP